MFQNWWIRLALVAACLSASGCATITTGRTQSISVITEYSVEGARCELNDTSDGKWFVSNSPGTVTVLKGNGPMTVTCKKDGFETTTLNVEETFAGATLGNLLLGGGIGIIVDAASGAAQQYPDQIVLWMRPEKWKSDQEKQKWDDAKELYDKKQEEKRKAKQADPAKSRDE